jgi:glycosyltransferase involved in cell wall biosynthesis
VSAGVDGRRRGRSAVLEGPVTYSFVVPVFNERDVLPELAQRLSAVLDALDGPGEVILVDDGSTDGSHERLWELNQRDGRFRALRLSRNFGHQVAIAAGLDHADGHAVIIMDADLQDPPEVAVELARKWREGYDVVYAVRSDRAGESRAKLLTASWFYRLLSRMSDVPVPPNVGDFRLVDRRVLHVVGNMPEHRPFLRGMFAWVGFDQTGVTYARAARPAGATKYPLRKMVAFALDGITSFSTAPLRLVLKAGFAVSALSFALGVATIVFKLAGLDLVPGWASILTVLAFLGGIQLTVLGVIGEYVGRIHEEVKRRPLYLIRETVGIGAEPREAVPAIDRPPSFG